MPVTFASLLVSLIFSIAVAAKGFALRTSENRDAFSKCVATEALMATSVFSLNKLLYAQPIKDVSPASIAYLYFSAKTQGGSDLILRLALKTQDHQGWSLVQGENGEIYPFATTVEPKALLINPKTGVLGARDISSCLNAVQRDQH